MAPVYDFTGWFCHLLFIHCCGYGVKVVMPSSLVTCIGWPMTSLMWLWRQCCGVLLSSRHIAALWWSYRRTSTWIIRRRGVTTYITQHPTSVLIHLTATCWIKQQRRICKTIDSKQHKQCFGFAHARKHPTLNQCCCFNVVPASQTVDKWIIFNNFVNSR